MDPTTISALEQGITARLQARVQGVAIEAYPDKPESYRLVHQVGALLVCYRGARYTDPEDVGEVVQVRDMWFDVHVLARSLSGHQGAYVHLEAGRLALTGFRVPGFRKLTPRREAFLGHKEGVWMFALTLSAATIAAELDETTAGALLQRLTLAGDFATSEIPNG
jgi:hypothetical protein